MTVSERIEEVMEMMGDELNMGTMGYSAYRMIYNALDSLYRDVKKSELESKEIPDGYISLGKLQEIGNNRPLFLIALCNDGTKLKDWVTIGFSYTDLERALIDGVRGNVNMRARVRDYGKTWFCYMENPFMQI